MGIVALFVVGGIFSFVATMSDFMAGSRVSILDINDMAKVKDVLFGGEPWLIYCVDEKYMDKHLPKFLEESAPKLYSSLGVNTGVLDCFKTLGSGRNVAQK